MQLNTANAFSVNRTMLQFSLLCLQWPERYLVFAVDLFELLYDWIETIRIRQFVQKEMKNVSRFVQLKERSLQKRMIDFK